LDRSLRRNLKRFPDDFAFQLSKEDLENWRSQIVTSNPSILSSKLTGRKYLRPLLIGGDRRNELVEEIVELGGGREVDGLRQVILWTVIANLIPLAIASLGLSAWVITEDEADGRHVFEEERVLIGPTQQISLGFDIRTDFYV
jgi:hypothetical protein